MKGPQQVASSDVFDLMLVFVRVVTERTVVVFETYRSFHVGVLHGVQQLPSGDQTANAVTNLFAPPAALELARSGPLRLL